MTELPIRIGILQITGQPAAVLGTQDFFAEPIPQRNDLFLDPLKGDFPRIKTLLREIRQQHLEWTKERLTGLLEELKASPAGPPDVLAIPEFFCPVELLPIVRDYAISTKTTVLAGTHSRVAHRGPDQTYLDIGVDPKSLTQIPVSCSSLLPIVQPTRTTLRQKLTLSPDEYSEVCAPEDDLPTLPVVAVESVPGLTLGALICNEALRDPSFTPSPRLVAIVARDKNPAQFASQINVFVKNKKIVVFANDAEFGGSGVLLIVDSRPQGAWWFAPQNQGRLPSGEAYLEVLVELGTHAAEVGTSRPAPQAVLKRLTSIIGSDDPHLALERRAATLAMHPDQFDELRHVCHEILGHPSTSAVGKRRWNRVLELIDAGTMNDDWRAVLIGPIVTGGAVSLDTHYKTVAARAARELDALLHDSGSTSLARREALGELFARHQLFQKLNTAQRTAPPLSRRVPGIPPIGRNDIIRDLRELVSANETAFLSLTGTPGIGKSAVIDTALSQLRIDSFQIDCPPGTSADYLYEYLLRSAGIVPVTSAPRTTFEQIDLRQALIGVKAIWFSSAENLLDASHWATEALGTFFKVLQNAVAGTSVKALIFESSRDLPFDRDTQAVVRKRLLGLPPPEGRDLLSQYLRRADIPDDAVSDEQRLTIARMVDGHPTLLDMAAHACGRLGSTALLQDLKGRGHFYRSLARVLIRRIPLSEAEKKYLAALTECRLPVPRRLIDYVMPPEDAAKVFPAILGTGLVDLLPGDLVQANLLLHEGSIDGTKLSATIRRQFHEAAADYFWTVANDANSIWYLRAAVEVNYHSSLAGLKEPIAIGGLRDGVVAAARQKYEAEDFGAVVSLLEPLIAKGIAHTPEDVLSLLADSYAWTDRISDSLRLADELISRSTSYVWVLIEAINASLHSRRLSDAERALAKAEEVAPDDYRVVLQRGRILERRKKRREALDAYERAADVTTKDIWPFFWLARCLRQMGLPAEALAAIERSRDFANERRRGRVGRRLELALLSEEMFCLFLTGNTERAAAIASLITADPSASAEALVSAAFGRALSVVPFDENTALQAFEDAVKKLERHDSNKAHTRATISLFRGKLWERLGEAERAERAFSEAATLDPYNAHMKECLVKAMRTRIKQYQRAQREPAARTGAQELAKVVRALLQLEPANGPGRDAQEWLFREFEIQ